MDDFLAVVDPQGLTTLIVRLAHLRQQLEKVDGGPRAIESAKKSGYDADSVRRVAAAEQLIAVLSFLEDSESLAPELHQLLNALLNIERGLPVAWLQPKRTRQDGRPPVGFLDASMHARFAWVMDFLMEKGNKGEKEAARFVVKHGHLRRWLNDRSRANSAAPWQAVANWRNRIIGGSCTQEERIAFNATAEMVNPRVDTPRDAEGEARKLLRRLKIYFSRD